VERSDNLFARALELKFRELGPSRWAAFDLLAEHKAAEVMRLLQREAATFTALNVSIVRGTPMNTVKVNLFQTVICSLEARENDFLVKELNGTGRPWSEHSAPTVAEAIKLLGEAVAMALVRSRTI
jgi:hypothetical protein